jgi:ABC-2 type transport system permease protein
MRIQIPNYTMFLFTALIPWTFFTTTVSQGSFSVIASGNLLKKVYFPREIIPISVVTSNLVNFLISCVIMFTFILVSGVGFSKYIVFFPIIVLIQYLLLMGITLILSAVTVFVRDLEHIITVLLMVMLYGTPILYSMDMVPESIRKIISLNPMTPVISAYRDVLFYQVKPDIGQLGIILGVSIGLQRGFAEEF